MEDSKDSVTKQHKGVWYKRKEEDDNDYSCEQCDLYHDCTSNVMECMDKQTFPATYYIWKEI